MDKSAEFYKCHEETTEIQELNHPRDKTASQGLWDLQIITDIHCPENDQTWLYYREGTNPDERIDLSEWLTIKNKAIDSHKLYRKLQSADEGGGYETRENLRDRKSSTNESNGVQINNGQAYQSIVSHPIREDLKVEVALDNDVQESIHSRKINGHIYTDGGISLISNDKKGLGTVNLMTEANDDRKEEDNIFLNWQIPKYTKINEVTPPSLSNSDGRLNSSTNKLVYFSSKLNHDTWSSSDKDNTSFSPSSVSTPKSKVIDIAHNNNNCEPGNFISSQTFNSQPEETINNTYIKTRDDKLNILSQSDPAITETYENSRENNIMMGTFSKSVSVKEQLCSIKFREGNSVGSEGNLNITGGLSFVKISNDIESHSNSNSSSSSHIRSLDDVRTAARQQEESLNKTFLDSQKINERAQSVDDCGNKINNLNAKDSKNCQSLSLDFEKKLIYRRNYDRKPNISAKKKKESTNIGQMPPVRSYNHDNEDLEMKLKLGKSSGKIIEKKQIAQSSIKNIGCQSTSIDNSFNVIRSSEIKCKTKKDEGMTLEWKPTGLFKGPLRFPALSQVHTKPLLQSKSEENCSRLCSEKLVSTLTLDKDTKLSGDASSSSKPNASQADYYLTNSNVKPKSRIPRPSNGIKSKLINPH